MPPVDLTDQEFDSLLASFEHSAFRLEARESYAGVSYEIPVFARWLDDELPESDPDSPWMHNVQAATAAGKRFARVRVVTEHWSDCTRFALCLRRNVWMAEERHR